ncbi:DUF4349 domain-containing protein [Pedobacter gandavensis]|uniref:DUF4349 domain-containing protein n=1 Tax=Pedobacter gandavensis TaxID=2679963 RepID=UPI00292F0697|nr:DUF4349 domain-containing protein [Pedobacter gandavensis]
MKKYIIYCAVAIVFTACSQNKQANEAAVDASAISILSADSSLTEKIIKTADMRFRVKDVQQTKVKLAELIKEEGGRLWEFSIQSEVYQSEKVRYSTDSLLELTSYRTEGLVVAKIPADKLDVFTNKVAGIAVFVDQQSMKLDDQSLNYLSNQMKTQNREEAVAQLKSSHKKSTQIGKTVDLKDDEIDQKIQNKMINDRVKYSDIRLSFYQDNTVKKLVVGNDNLSDYKPTFFRRLGLNVQNGWLIFKEFLLMLANLWMLILLAIAGFVAYRQYRKSRKLKV